MPAISDKAVAEISTSYTRVLLELPIVLDPSRIKVLPLIYQVPATVVPLLAYIFPVVVPALRVICHVVVRVPLLFLESVTIPPLARIFSLNCKIILVLP